MSINMRDDYIDALRMNFKAQIEKHRINVENLMNNSVGIGEHGDIMEMADKSDKLEMLDYFEVEIGSKKVIKG